MSKNIWKELWQLINPNYSRDAPMLKFVPMETANDASFHEPTSAFLSQTK